MIVCASPFNRTSHSKYHDSQYLLQVVSCVLSDNLSVAYGAILNIDAIYAEITKSRVADMVCSVKYCLYLDATDSRTNILS